MHYLLSTIVYLCLTLFLIHPISSLLGAIDIVNLLRQKILAPSLDTSLPLWSHKPYCTTSSAKNEYCVYTLNTTRFDDLSIISTSANANKISRLLQNASSWASHQIPSPKSWKVVDIPGKNKGVVATREIKKFETIMLDQVVLLVDVDTPEDLSGDLLNMAVNRARNSNAIHNLDAAESKGTFEQRIVRTNAFGTTISDIGFKALFPDVARINHACSPNAYVLFSPSGLSMSIRTSRDISEGEEIGISYIPLGSPSHTRITLLSPWSFTCTCPLCALLTLEKRTSDIRRTLLSRTEAKILDFAAQGRVDEAIALAVESVELIRDEGLEAMLTDEYAMLAMLWLSKGERREAEMWGKEAWAMLVERGYLGEEEEEGGFELERLLGGIGGLGGDGRGKKWRR